MYGRKLADKQMNNGEEKNTISLYIVKQTYGIN